MLIPSEKFLIYIILGLIGFLAFVSLFTFTFVFKRKKIVHDGPLYRARVKKKKRKVRTARKETDIGGSFMEKLGQKVVRYLVEISQSGEKNYVKERVQRTIQECERLNGMELPEENKKIISTVLLWARGFEPDRHVSEMKIFDRSSQIVYDRKKKNFKLRLFGK